jgi:formylglycine-generating enzyme required for sulfatase activity
MCVGNAWEWTSDYFAALPGFEVHPFYEDFSTPCFDGLHHVIQGGSFISTGTVGPQPFPLDWAPVSLSLHRQ